MYGSVLILLEALRDRQAEAVVLDLELAPGEAGTLVRAARAAYGPGALALIAVSGQPSRPRETWYVNN